MASIDDGELYLEIPNAKQNELRMGLIAFRRSFEQSGVSPEDAFLAYFEREGADMMDTWDDLDPSVLTRAEALDKAGDAAITAATLGWLERPFNFNFGLWEVVKRNRDEGGIVDGFSPDTHFHMEPIAA